MKTLRFAALVPVLLAATACGPVTSKEATMQLTTTAFTPGGRSPPSSPPTARTSPRPWPGPARPRAPRAFALIMDDPDAPVGLWTHWVVLRPAGLRPRASSRASPAPPRCPFARARAATPGAAWAGTAPAPPPGKPHRYFFRIYALSGPLGLEAGATAAKVKEAMKGKVLAEGSVMGTYGR